MVHKLIHIVSVGNEKLRGKFTNQMVGAFHQKVLSELSVKREEEDKDEEYPTLRLESICS